jgi:hypothetical protein
MNGPAPSPFVVDKEDAAKLCGVSVRTFERHVQRHLEAIPIGGRYFYAPEDIKRWLDAQKAGTCTSTNGRGSGSSGSRMRGALTSSPRAREIERRLLERQRASSPRLFPVDAAEDAPARPSPRDRPSRR